MYKARPVIFAAAILVSGCVTPAQEREIFSQGMNAWIGRSSDDLVLARGTPSGTFTLSTGEKVFEYSRSDVVTSGGGSYTVNQSVYVPGANGAPGNYVTVPQQQTAPISSQNRWCKTIFRISKDNSILAWTADGNACY